MLTMAAFIWSNTVKTEILLQFKTTAFNTFFKVYFSNGKAEFSAAIAPVFSVLHKSF